MSFSKESNDRDYFSQYKRGQNITEYLILVAGVLVVVILAVSKGGFFTKGVEKSINMMFDSVSRTWPRCNAWGRWMTSTGNGAAGAAGARARRARR